jgi:ABC-type glutathione transport system ATPase component
LSNVSLTIDSDDVLGIVGESGSGKTTLARVLTGLVRPNAGKCLYDFTDIWTMSRANFQLFRRQVQLVFQDPLASLPPRMRVDRIVADALHIHHIGIAAERLAAARSMLRRVGINETLFERYPIQLSGGQCQRVLIARALVLQPRVLLLDEPVASLDVSVRGQILNLISDLQQQFGFAVVMISHDLSTVRSFVKRVVVLLNGEIVEAGSAAQVLSVPEHPYTRELLESTLGIETDKKLFEG